MPDHFPQINRSPGTTFGLRLIAMRQAVEASDGKAFGEKQYRVFWRPCNDDNCTCHDDTRSVFVCHKCWETGLYGDVVYVRRFPAKLFTTLLRCLACGWEHEIPDDRRDI